MILIQRREWLWDICSVLQVAGNCEMYLMLFIGFLMSFLIDEGLLRLYFVLQDFILGRSSPKNASVRLNRVGKGEGLDMRAFFALF